MRLRQLTTAAKRRKNAAHGVTVCGKSLASYQGMPSQAAEKVLFRIRVCLQAYRKSLKMRPALAAEPAFNRHEMTLSTTSSVRRECVSPKTALVPQVRTTIGADSKY